MAVISTAVVVVTDRTCVTCDSEVILEINL